VDLTGDYVVSVLPAYEGQTVNGSPHGQGVVAFKEGKWKGCVYRGDFEHGVMEWKEDGVQDCVGEMRYLSGKFAGCVYEGAFISTSLRDSAASLGRRHGHGTIRYANGDVYTGEWMTGFPSGRGEIAYSDGERYAGQWNNGSKGYGVTTLPPVELLIDAIDSTAAPERYLSFEGEHRCNSRKRMNGVVRFPNGDRYRGEVLREGLTLSGKGVMNFENVEWFEGFFEDGLSHGAGKMVMSDCVT
jgi:hypothetical protein